MSDAPLLTIVIAVLDEAENIGPVCAELAPVLSGLPSTELVFVDDGSTDDTCARLIAARQDVLPCPTRIFSHDRRRGKSAALRTGIEAARGTWIATMDGDGQDDPRALVDMMRAALAHTGRPPLVVGVRRKRNDTLSRRLATRFANGLRQRLLRDGCPDTGAPQKLFPRADFLRIPQFEGVHRFLPALLGTYGVPLLCVPVVHRGRLHGQSKYTNFNRALVGIRDLLGVMWLRNRTRLPGAVTEH
ncbi:glycosyltransferase [Ameyamaea chiangmaiensis NBRC 103196]|uniref:Glycosyltransferase family 2 protein n=1 Tax=Ameyamaea chiangmaiensis TaxID=442969 RepID=A0A850PKI6_9PROT|nr:glycosyltransferase family 2 protein [Ameyamaea chiangmaiensis]MBS4075322.1 glycosyltransferase family 2 protein [Ameyamaea chiangmaiensis]NVN41831.1 glycosyltransferase family 2 protein [Ameyamaea chiangmaiensis]GBQ66751.1 glycosyltransferase [Ameyamaea chiangmaiensis NBRC 103196]